MGYWNVAREILFGLACVGIGWAVAAWANKTAFDAQLQELRLDVRAKMKSAGIPVDDEEPAEERRLPFAGESRRLHWSKNPVLD